MPLEVFVWKPPLVPCEKCSLFIGLDAVCKASSTFAFGAYCFVVVSERRRSTPAPKEEEKVNEEQWSLREVVFVEDVKNVPVGKVRGNQARFPGALGGCLGALLVGSSSRSILSVAQHSDRCHFPLFWGRF